MNMTQLSLNKMWLGTQDQQLFSVSVNNGIKIGKSSLTQCQTDRIYFNLNGKLTLKMR